MIRGVLHPLLTSVVRVVCAVFLCLQRLDGASTCTCPWEANFSLVMKNFSEFLTTSKSATLSDILQQLSNRSAATNAPANLEDGVHLDLSRNGLKDFDLPVENYRFAENVVALDVSHNQLENLTDGPLSRFPKLAHVQLAFNILSTLSAKTLPAKVSHLDISGNRLRSVEKGMLGDFLNVLTASRNTISELVPGSLPKGLRCLDLSFNDLRFLRDGAFRGLVALESLNLSHNQLATIQPHAFHVGRASLKTADLSFNSLTSYEPWPYLFTCNNKPFVGDLRYNNISRFTNSMNMSISCENKFAKVDLRHNDLTRMSLQDLSIYYGERLPNAFEVDNLELNVMDNPWLCDCSMYGLVSAYSQSLLRGLKYVDAYLTCHNPPHLRGRTFGFLIGHPDLLTCRVTDGCPQGCLCFNRPHRGYVEVSCDRDEHLYTGLPSEMPPVGFLFLNLSGHELDVLDSTVPYVGRLYQLDVSGNRLLELTSSFLEQASSLVALNVSHNRLTSLPRLSRRLGLQHLRLVGNPFQCSCDFIWFGEWLRFLMANASVSENTQETSLGSDAEDGAVPMTTNFSHEVQLLTCALETDGMLPLVDITADRLGCRRLTPAVVASVCCLLLLLLCAFVACWRKRYELKVLSYFWLWNCCRFKGGVNDAGSSIEQFDVYISVDEDDKDAVLWLQQEMLPLLEGGGRPLLVYVPMRQELAGNDKSRARADAIQGSRNTLALITPGYAKNGWCRFEFDQACRYLEEENTGKLVLLKMICGKYQNHRIVNATRDPRLQQTTCDYKWVEISEQQEWGSGGLQHPGRNDLQQPPELTLLHGITLPPDTGAPALACAHPLDNLTNPRLAHPLTKDPGEIVPFPQGVEEVEQELDHRDSHMVTRRHYNTGPATRCTPHQHARGPSNFLLWALHGCSCGRPCTARLKHKDNLELSQFCDVTGQADTLESLNAFLMEEKFISLEDYLWKHKVFFELSTYKKT